MMQDHYRIMILADTHIGAERRPWLRKLGVKHYQYDRPAAEAMLWAYQNKVDVTVIAGDMFDKRVPTPEDYIRGQQLAPDLVVAGNHDVTAVGHTDALWNMRHVVRGRSDTVLASDVQIVGLPWPRPVDWLHEAGGTTIGDEIAETRSNLLEALDTRCKALSVDRPAILVGHAMVSYGGTDVDGPSLMLGKDVVLPYEALRALPNIGGVYLGHVHDSTAPGYVGSTQPTDWGDTGPKSFTVVDIKKVDHADTPGPFNGGVVVNGWNYVTRQIPYTTSLKLGVFDNETYLDSSGVAYDGIRLNWKMAEGDSPDGLERCRQVVEKDPLHPYVEVIVEHEVKRAARVKTAEPLAKMQPLDSLNVWLDQRLTAMEDMIIVEGNAHEIMSHDPQR